MFRFRRPHASRVGAPAALGLVAAAVLAGDVRPAPEHLCLTNASVVDVRSGRVLPNTTVLVRDRKIASIGASLAPGARVIDVGGRYLLPGLVDAHAHLSNAAAARVALESGVTTARCAGVANYADVGLRELARQGAIAGPDILASGYQVRPDPMRRCSFRTRR